MTDLHWTHQLRRRLIVFDGPDGSGKSTQLKRLSDYLIAHDQPTRTVREPGGTLIGEQVREILLNPSFDQMSTACELFLYMASRTQLMTEQIVPALENDQCVLADRFISSTFAYQGTAGGMTFEQIHQMGQIALGDHWPDLFVIFDIDPASAAARMNRQLDRIEQKSLDYHARVRQGYLDQALADPRRYIVLDARADEETIFQQLCHVLANRWSSPHPRNPQK